MDEIPNIPEPSVSRMIPVGEILANYSDTKVANAGPTNTANLSAAKLYKKRKYRRAIRLGALVGIIVGCATGPLYLIKT